MEIIDLKKSTTYRKMNNNPVIVYSIKVLLILTYLDKFYSVSVSGTNHSRQVKTNPKVSEEILCRNMFDFMLPLKVNKDTRFSKPIAIVGNNIEYTGTPYTISASAVMWGVNHTYAFSSKAIVNFVHCYSDDMRVYPYLDDPKGNQLIGEHLPKVSSLIFGPVLGVNEENFGIFRATIEDMKKNNSHMPLIFDQDGIKLVARSKGLLSHYQGDVYVTPNVNEIVWLKNAYPVSEYMAEHNQKNPPDESDYIRYIAGKISPKATIIIKGIVDTIYTPKYESKCSVKCSIRHVEGAGDILTGSLGQFARLASAFEEKKGKNHEGVSDMSKLLAAYSACAVTRMANHAAYEDIGGMMTAFDTVKFLRGSLDNSIPYQL